MHFELTIHPVAVSELDLLRLTTHDRAGEARREEVSARY